MRRASKQRNTTKVTECTLLGKCDCIIKDCNICLARKSLFLLLVLKKLAATLWAALWIGPCGKETESGLWLKPAGVCGPQSGSLRETARC